MRNVKFRLSSALKKCVWKPFISFYLSAAGVRDIAAQTVKKRKIQIYLQKWSLQGGKRVIMRLYKRLGSQKNLLLRNVFQVYSILYTIRLAVSSGAGLHWGL